MSNYARQEKLEEYKYSLCSGMGMKCGRCICEGCPRDCEECDERGIQAGTPWCLHEGNGVYRKEGGTR